MKPDPRHLGKNRRDFFRKAAAMGAAALFGTVNGPKAQAAPEPSAPPSRTRSRYRLTAHIRRYYRRAGL